LRSASILNAAQAFFNLIYILSNCGVSNKQSKTVECYGTAGLACDDADKDC
jgi:hypothetical protein